MNSTVSTHGYTALSVFVVSWRNQRFRQCCPTQRKSITSLVCRVIALIMMNSFTNERDKSSASQGELLVTFHSTGALPSHLVANSWWVLRSWQVPGSPQEHLMVGDFRQPKKMVRASIRGIMEQLLFPSCFQDSLCPPSKDSHRISYQHDADSSRTALWLIFSVRVFLVDETVNISFCNVWMYSTLKQTPCAMLYKYLLHHLWSEEMLVQTWLACQKDLVPDGGKRKI